MCCVQGRLRLVECKGLEPSRGGAQYPDEQTCAPRKPKLASLRVHFHRFFLQAFQSYLAGTTLWWKFVPCGRLPGTLPCVISKLTHGNKLVAGSLLDYTAEREHVKVSDNTYEEKIFGRRA
jgi:hypothetical protein